MVINPIFNSALSNITGRLSAKNMKPYLEIYGLPGLLAETTWS